jgi:hypothetical protein
MHTAIHILCHGDGEAVHAVLETRIPYSIMNLIMRQLKGTILVRVGITIIYDDL